MIDTDYAPTGCYASAPERGKDGRPLCIGCAFRLDLSGGVCTLPELTCVDGTRPDGEDVIFLRSSESQ